jgi:glucokinase
MLGVDIGGTKVAVGAVTRKGEVRGEVQFAPTDTSSAQDFVRSLVEVLRQARDGVDGDLQGVGLGCAGTIDWERGIVVESPNLPVKNEPLRDKVAEALSLPTVLDNDANVAALAEARVGAARGLEHVIMLTLGTGVGGGIVLNGRLYRGVNGSAGELGHTIVMGGDDPCQCGRRGCLEVYASGTALERVARRLAAQADAGGDGTGASNGYGRALNELRERGQLEGEEVGRLALEGDQAARDAVAEVARWVGVGLANFANIFNPQMIVVGGGLGNLGELILSPARELMRQMAIAPNGETAQVKPAQLGPEAGVVGAALVAWEELGVMEPAARPGGDLH